MSHTVKDYKKSDQCAAASLLNALISWVNKDHEDTLTISHNQGCYIRDEIERLRKAEQDNVALKNQLHDEALAFNHANGIVAELETENVALRAKAYRDMCADGHMQIGFSGEEFGPCPLCALRAKVAKLEAPVSNEEWHPMISYEANDTGFASRENVDALIAARGREGE